MKITYLKKNKLIRLASQTYWLPIIHPLVCSFIRPPAATRWQYKSVFMQNPHFLVLAYSSTNVRKAVIRTPEITSQCCDCHWNSSCCLVCISLLSNSLFRLVEGSRAENKLHLGEIQVIAARREKQTKRGWFNQFCPLLPPFRRLTLLFPRDVLFAWKQHLQRPKVTASGTPLAEWMAFSTDPRLNREIAHYIPHLVHLPIIPVCLWHIPPSHLLFLQTRWGCTNLYICSLEWI